MNLTRRGVARKPIVPRIAARIVPSTSDCAVTMSARFSVACSDEQGNQGSRSDADAHEEPLRDVERLVGQAHRSNADRSQSPHHYHVGHLGYGLQEASSAMTGQATGCVVLRIAPGCAIAS